MKISSWTVGATLTASNQPQSASNRAEKAWIGQQGGSSRIHAPGGKNIWYPNEHHLPISFYLPTALSVGVGWLLAHCRERKGGAGLKHGMQQALGCSAARRPCGCCSLVHSDLLPQGEGRAMLRSLLPRRMQAGWHWTSAWRYGKRHWMEKKGYLW